MDTKPTTQRSVKAVVLFGDLDSVSTSLSVYRICSFVAVGPRPSAPRGPPFPLEGSLNGYMLSSH